MKGEKETTKGDELRSGNLVLQAVNQLCSHFEAYSDIPKITELREKFKGIKDMLKSHIFSDFSSLGTAGLSEDGQQMQQLADACLVINALDPSAKEELIRNVCSKELTAYQQIFQGTGSSLMIRQP
jgi:hypothetical protein